VDSRAVDPAKLALVALNGFIGTVKFPYLITGMISVAVITLDQAIGLKRRDRLPIPLLVYLIALSLAWVLGGQSLRDFPVYFKSSMDVASGYSEAMIRWQVDEVWNAMRVGATAMLLVVMIGLSAARLLRWRRTLLLLFGLIPLLHINFRSGF